MVHTRYSLDSWASHTYSPKLLDSSRTSQRTAKFHVSVRTPYRLQGTHVPIDGLAAVVERQCAVIRL